LLVARKPAGGRKRYSVFEFSRKDQGHRQLVRPARQWPKLLCETAPKGILQALSFLENFFIFNTLPRFPHPWFNMKTEVVSSIGLEIIDKYLKS
jgi:hypothetical protein